MTQISIPGWTICPVHTSAFVRTFVAHPESDYPVEYPTQERKGDRFIEAVYPARIVAVSIRYQWEQKDGGFWWGRASGDIALVSEKTGERYKTGWRSALIRDHFASWEMNNAPEYIKALLDATHPRTMIAVTEAPA